MLAELYIFPGTVARARLELSKFRAASQLTGTTRGGKLAGHTISSILQTSGTFDVREEVVVLLGVDGTDVCAG